jgi:transcriptional regulator with XRE-family HTH domain
MTTRRANPTDVIIGHNIRAHRMKLRMTQSELAGAVGVTWQQIQKYENASNRVPAGRLYDIARALRISIGLFFVEGDFAVGSSHWLPSRR